jgi:transcriptional regulator with XRE-family HTH domain
MKTQVTESDLKLAQLLRQTRKNAGLSQRDVAKQLGLKSNQPVFVSLIENGASKLPPRLAPVYAVILGLRLKRISTLLIAASREAVIKEIETALRG